MPQDRRHWPDSESASSGSHWRPNDSNSSYDDYASRHYTPYQHIVRNAGRSFNYWRDDPATLSYPPRSYQSYRPDSYDERRRGDSRLRSDESSRSREWRDSGPRSERESRRERSPTRSQHTSRQHYSTYTQSPYLVPRTLRSESPPRGLIAPSEHQQAPNQPQRKVSPPPTMSTPPPLVPDSAYLALTQSPSEVLRSPTSVRKLLVVDLNGTLLIRSQHSGVRHRDLSSYKLRAVQPRPYMRSLREYLFSPKTKEWLDTMVWSSAQPHSVEDMVDKVFGPFKTELKAVWNRKSLGLSEEAYHRKSLTTKDLTKPWKLLPLGFSPEEHDGGSLPSSQSQIMHSASTTLLLDDSPHKAALQPYNHVCIAEYDSARRHRDLQSLQATREPREGKRKKKDGSHARVEDASSTLPHDAPPESIEGREPFDATLLAVIGVLEAMKVQSNVAGWIRQGGLWAGAERSVGGPSNTGRPSTDETSGGTTDETAVVQTGNDESSTSDPAVTPEEAHLQTAMWFSDSTTMAHWVARGRETLEELGIDVSHGVTG